MSSARERVCRVAMSMMPRGLGAAAAPLAGFDAEQLLDAGAPLVGERFAVDEDER